jgi:hypothetical protein
MDRRSRSVGLLAHRLHTQFSIEEIRSRGSGWTSPGIRDSPRRLIPCRTRPAVAHALTATLPKQAERLCAGDRLLSRGRTRLESPG